MFLLVASQAASILIVRQKAFGYDNIFQKPFFFLEENPKDDD
jgi:hypothetical protein